MRSLSTSVPTVVAALLLSFLGVIAISETKVSTPGEIGLSMDARLVRQLDDQEATLNQRRQAETLLRAFVRGQLASFYWGQFASSLVDLGLSSDKNVNVRVETKGSSTRLWVSPQRGSETMLRLCISMAPSLLGVNVEEQHLSLLTRKLLFAPKDGRRLRSLRSEFCSP